MARGNVPLHTFNRGRISRLGLARTDLERTRLSAEVQTNWIPRTLGSMMLRPGFEYISATESNSSGLIVPFIFSTTDTAIVELTNQTMRVHVDDALITRDDSTAAITNGTFNSTLLTGWTDSDETGSTSEWVEGNYLGLTGTRFARARRRQTVVSSSGNHGLSVVVERGHPILRVGSSAGTDDYIEETELGKGNYSFVVESTGNFFVELSANTQYASLVDSITVESSGAMSIPTTWNSSDLNKLKFEQSGDVIFVAAEGFVQKKIERRIFEKSCCWDVVDYAPEDGPFRNINITNKRLTPSALTGNIVLECDKPLFRSGNVGSLYEITSIGQQVEITVTDDDQFSDPIRVSGVDDSRSFDILVSDHASTANTIRVQRSVGEVGNWANVSGLSFTSTVSQAHDDGLDNQIIFYRIGSESGDIGSTANSITGELSYASGGITGIAKVTSVISATESSAIVLKAFGSTAASELWSEGDWSSYRGFPTAVALHEGRVFWAGRSKLWGSVSDAFESFDANTEGDSGPINLTIGKGPVDSIPWLESQDRLIIGTQGAEKEAKTSSLEEPLTPTNFALRDVSNQGSANVQSINIDNRTFFVQTGGVRVFEIAHSETGLDINTIDRTIVLPEAGEPGIVRMAVQRQPDTRIHCVRSDGTVGMLLTDPAENVLAWIDIETGDADGSNGVIEDVAILPSANDVEDKVYYLVKRMINGAAVRYIEKWAKESEARGGALNKMADSFLIQNSTSTTTITGLDHLAGETAIVWGATADLGSYTVSTTGEITGVSQASTTFVAGLPYSGLYRSAKLAYADSAGTALLQRKRLSHVGIIAVDMHAQALQIGSSTGTTFPLPRRERSETISTDFIFSEYDFDAVPFAGFWDTDSRLVLTADAPRPVTVLGAVITIQTKDKI